MQEGWQTAEFRFYEELNDVLPAERRKRSCASRRVIDQLIALADRCRLVPILGKHLAMVSTGDRAAVIFHPARLEEEMAPCD